MTQSLTELEEQLISLMTGTIESLQLACSIAEYSEEMTAQEKRDFLLKMLSEIDSLNSDIVSQRIKALKEDKEETAKQLKFQYVKNVKLKLAINSQFMRVFHYL